MKKPDGKFAVKCIHSTIESSTKGEFRNTSTMSRKCVQNESTRTAKLSAAEITTNDKTHNNAVIFVYFTIIEILKTKTFLRIRFDDRIIEEKFSLY